MRVSRKDLPPVIAGALVIALGLVVITGWFTGNSALVQVHRGFAGMQFNTALSFIAAGVGMIALAHRGRVATLACSAWLGLAGVLTLAQYLSGVSLGIDQLLHASSSPDIVNPFPGRMAPNTALCFVLVGTVLALLATPLRFRLRSLVLVAGVATTLVLTVAVLLGYLTHLSIAFGWGMFTQMAVHTASGLLVLSAALLVLIRRDLSDGPAVAATAVAPVAWLVLVVALMLTVWAWYAATAFVLGTARARFDVATEQISDQIEHHMSDYERMLTGAKGLFAASHQVDRHEWSEYIQMQKLALQYPGVQAVGFAPRVAPNERDALVRAVRAEGFADFNIYPRRARAEYFPVLYVEPLDEHNRRSLGFDMASEATRAEAMQRARDSGVSAVSGRVALVTETHGDIHPGFVMYVPIYRGGVTPRALAARREQFHGFVYIPFAASTLFNAIQQIDDLEIAYQVYDDLNAAPYALIYDADSRIPGSDSAQAALFEGAREIEVGGRRWLITFRTRARFNAALPAYEPFVVLLGGTLASLLLFGIAWSLATTRARALVLAGEMTQKLRVSEQRFRLLADQSQGLICEHDSVGKLLYVNEAAARSLGYAPEEMVGRNLIEFLTPRVRERFADYLARVNSGRDQGMFRILAKGGEEHVWKYDNARYDVPGGGVRVLGHAQEITEMVREQQALKAAKQTAQEEAALDALTGLNNRRMFDQHLSHAIEHARRHNEKLALLFIDLDGFKKINDTFGHDTGDRLLRHVADTLARSIRKSDLAARFGGDEFALVLGNIHTREDVNAVARKLTERLQVPLAVEGGEVAAKVSLGIALFPDDGDSAERLLRHADSTMYRVKRERAASLV
jgi:diguanylate cyclase (GGDEF)-like protein/PAS domain S-box-containing protein